MKSYSNTIQIHHLFILQETQHKFRLIIDILFKHTGILHNRYITAARARARARRASEASAIPEVLAPQGIYLYICGMGTILRYKWHVISDVWCIGDAYASICL